MRRIIVTLIVSLLASTAWAEEYFFAHVGMSVTSIDGWEVMSGAEFVALNRDASFGTDELDKLLQSDDGTPFFSMLSDIRLNSGVRAGFNAFSFEGALADVDVAAAQMVEYMMATFREAKMIRQPKRSSLNGVDAVNMAMTYRLDLADDTSQTIYEEVWLVPRETNYVTISYGTLAEDRDPELWRDIRRALASVSWQ